MSTKVRTTILSTQINKVATKDEQIQLGRSEESGFDESFFSWDGTMKLNCVFVKLQLQGFIES